MASGAKASPSTRDSQVLVAICSYLDKLSSRVDASASSSLSTASSALRSAFALNPASLAPADGGGLDLESIFTRAGVAAPAAAAAAAAADPNALPTFSDSSKDAVFVKYVDAITRKGFFTDFEKGTPEYAERLATAVDKFCGKFGVTVVDTVAEGAAAACKARGNAEMKAKRFERAVECYTEALVLSPSGASSHIYFCNRAAAQQNLQHYDEAAEDSRDCIRLAPDYAKGHSRLGTALLKIGDLEGAADALRRCLELDPANKVAQQAIARVEVAQRGGGAVMPDMSGAAPSLPGAGGGGLASMMAAMGGGGAGGAPGGGGMPDLAGMMAAMGGGGAGGGGMPDIGALLQNPAMMQAAQGMYVLVSRSEALSEKYKPCSHFSLLTLSLLLLLLYIFAGCKTHSSCKWHKA